MFDLITKVKESMSIGISNRSIKPKRISAHYPLLPTATFFWDFEGSDAKKSLCGKTLVQRPYQQGNGTGTGRK